MPDGLLQIHRHRQPLRHTSAALRRGEIRIGFVGGSITDAVSMFNWPEPVAAWFGENFADCRVVVENAAIGATGSDLACFRAERELIAPGCDLVFVEFAVNDCSMPSDYRNRTREGLLRKLLAGDRRDVVIVYTYSQEFYADMIAGRVPASIAEFEALAEHYGVGSVWMSLHALNDVRAGRMQWAEWLPDGLHPQYRGSWSYAEAVKAFLRRELIDAVADGASAAPSDRPLPAPIDPMNWESAEPVPLASPSIRTRGPWVLRRFHSVIHTEQAWETHAPGATMSIDFTGRGICIGLDFGKRSAEFVYRLDGAPPTPAQLDRPWWVGDRGWYRLHLFADDLKPGPHHLELEVVHGNRDGCTGTEFRMPLVGVLPR